MHQGEAVDEVVDEGVVEAAVVVVVEAVVEDAEGEEAVGVGEVDSAEGTSILLVNC